MRRSPWTISTAAATAIRIDTLRRSSSVSRGTKPPRVNTAV